MRVLPAFAFAALAGAAGFATAEEAKPPVPLAFKAGCPDGQDNAGRAEGFRFLFENDMFSGHRSLNRNAESDRWYTNGLKFIATECPRKPEPRLGGAPMSGLAEFFLGASHQFGYTVGQLIYTPENLDLVQPQPTDRFWGGYAYVGSVAQGTRADGNIETLEVDVGVLGPLSLAEEAQTLIHKVRKFNIPQGWGNQLRTEPTLNAHYLRMYGGGHKPELIKGHLKGDVVPHYGVAIGTVFNYVHGGATFRIGDNLDAAPAGSIEIPSLGGVQPYKKRWNVFLRVDLRITAYNAFIDGGMFRGDPHPTQVELRPLTYMLNRGLSFETDDWRFTILFNRRSREFNNLPGSRSVHSFGTINFEYKFDAK
jgi:lipid A 3-O-deacylase